VTAIGCIFLLGLLFSVAHEINYANNAEAAVIYNNQWRSYTGLSTDTKPTLEEKHAGSTFTETNSGRIYLWNGGAWVLGDYLVAGYTTSATSRLTAVGESAAVYIRGFTIAGYMWDATSVNTSYNAVVQVRTVLGAWTNLDRDDVTYTESDQEGWISSNVAVQDSMKFKVTAEVGGTSGEWIYQATMARD